MGADDVKIHLYQQGNKAINMNQYHADRCIDDAIAFYANDPSATDEMIDALAQRLFEAEGL